VHHALYLPPFGELAEPSVLVDLAVAAEERGWDGYFLWDHILRASPDPSDIADPWVALAAVAAATDRMRLGPIVTPLARRRPQVVARQAMTLDRLAGGRLTLGLGLGVDTAGELTKFGELVDARERGDQLDEGAELLAKLLASEHVHHRGRYFTAEDVQLLPRTVQQPRLPIWMAARGGAPRPTRRAARYEGLMPIEVDDDGLARTVDLVVAERGSLDGFDIAVIAHPGADLPALEARGATWAMWAFWPGEPAADILARIERGPN
jgi:alkanesulfonate monooxygenase SsuD/methylene tetrahydromethanopterin reductase-like flavin-dependent oxidoreductase (luciferase family)